MLLSLFLFFVYLIPLINDLSELIVIVAVPPVSLGLKVNLAVRPNSHSGHGHDFILREVFLDVLDADLAGSLGAGLVVVRHCATVRAGTLAILSHLLLVGAQTPAVPRIIKRLLLLLVASHTLMRQGFFLDCLLISQIPRCLLDVLRHVGQVHLGFRWGWYVLLRHFYC